MKNHIVADSGCDVNKEYIDCEHCEISHVPLNLQVGDRVFIDDENLDKDEYLEAMEASSEAVKTSAPSPSLFFERFKLGENVFVVTLSSKLSATYQSAMAAKDMYIEEYGKKFIHIFDSLTASIGEGAVAMKVAELLKAGTAAEKVVEQVNAYINNMRTYFIIDKFDNLVKTGRVKPYVGKIAGFLNVKPICADKDGQITMLDKALGFTKAMTKLVKIIKDNTPDVETRTVAITHIKAYEKAIALKDELLKNIRPKDIVIQECRGITTTYGNRGGVVVAL